MARAIHAGSARAERAVRRAQLRGADRVAAGERAVRPRPGRVHRRGRGAGRPDRARRRRHAVPRRDRDDAQGPAGQAAARARGRRGPAHRRERDPPRRRALRRGDERRSPGGGRRGEFRSDLFYRLNVHRVHLPPLRERGGDLRPLIDHFLERFGAGTGVEGLRRAGLGLAGRVRLSGERPSARAHRPARRRGGPGTAARARRSARRSRARGHPRSPRPKAPSRRRASAPSAR